MSYGDGEVQWMRAGKGVIHEEMWDLDGCELKHKSIELFQLWVNLPAAAKDQPPFVKLLKPDVMPLLQVSEGVTIRVIAGDVSIHDEKQGNCLLLLLFAITLFPLQSPSVGVVAAWQGLQWAFCTSQPARLAAPFASAPAMKIAPYLCTFAAALSS